MTHLYPFCIILGFTLAGEALQRLLPLPIPASVYGLVLLFLALCTGLIKVERLKKVSAFLTSILPVLFVAPAVRIVEYWDLISPNLIPIMILLLASTVLTFGISGGITQAVLKKEGKDCE